MPMKNKAGGCNCCGEGCAAATAVTPEIMTDRETGLVADARSVYEGLQYPFYYQYAQITPGTAPASGTKLVYSVKGQGSSDSTGPVAPYDFVLTFDDGTFTWNGVSVSATRLTVTRPSGRYTCTDTQTEFFCLYYDGMYHKPPTNGVTTEPGGFGPPTQTGAFMTANTPGVAFPAREESSTDFVSGFKRNTQYDDNSGIENDGGDLLGAANNSQEFLETGEVSTIPYASCFKSIGKNYNCSPVFTLTANGISVWAGKTNEVALPSSASVAELVWTHVDSGGNLRGVKGLDFIRTGGMDHDTAIVELEIFDSGGNHLAVGTTSWSFFEEPYTGEYGTIADDANCGAACGYHARPFQSNPSADPSREQYLFGTVQEQINIHDVDISWNTINGVSAEPSTGMREAILTQNVDSRCLFNKSAWAKEIPSCTETTVTCERVDNALLPPIENIDLGSNPTFTIDHWLRGYSVQLYFADDQSGGLDAILNIRPYMRTLDNLFAGLGVDGNSTAGRYIGYRVTPYTIPYANNSTYAGWSYNVQSISAHPTYPFDPNYQYTFRWVWDGSIDGGYGTCNVYGPPAGGHNGMTATTTTTNDGAIRQGVDSSGATSFQGLQLAEYLSPLICAKKSVPTSTLQKGSDGRFLTETITFSSGDFDSRYNVFPTYFSTGGTLGFGSVPGDIYGNTDYFHCDLDVVAASTPIINSVTVDMNP